MEAMRSGGDDERTHAVGGRSVQIQNADKTQGQNTPHQRKNPSIPSDIEGYMAHPRGARSEGESPTAGRDRTVELHRERRGQPCFFEIEQGQKGRNPGPARTKARTKMWEAVAGFVVEAEAPKITMPEHVEFVGNWESDDEVVERGMVVLN